MPPVLRALPYFDHRTSVRVGAATIDFVPFQIVVWVSFAPDGASTPLAGAPRFPAVLDTGFSGTFAITPGHLRRWAGIEWRTLPFDPRVRLQYHGVEVPHRRGNLWLYPNQYGWRDLIEPHIPPLLLELPGIAVYGDGEQVGATATSRLIGPRLPLLGLRALTMNRVQLNIDTPNRAVWLDGE
jgi:hypothetical protein